MPLTCWACKEKRILKKDVTVFHSVRTELKYQPRT